MDRETRKEIAITMGEKMEKRMNELIGNEAYHGMIEKMRQCHVKAGEIVSKIKLPDSHRGRSSGEVRNGFLFL